MNLRATVSHGTLEFRAMEGNLDVDRINTWVQTLCLIKDAAMKIEDPRDIPQALSRLGPHEWVTSIIGDSPLSRAILASPDLFESIYEGIRLAQDVCYAIDWTATKPTGAPLVRDEPMEIPVGANIWAEFAAGRIEVAPQAPPRVRVAPRGIDNRFILDEFQ